MTNLVEHAKAELNRAGVEPEYAAKIVDIVRIFADTADSGSLAEFLRPIISDLLEHKNLTPITDDPDEWVHHGEEMWGEKGGIWQNVRNPKAFSRDGGKHYWLLEDRPNAQGTKPHHTSMKHKE